MFTLLTSVLSGVVGAVIDTPLGRAVLMTVFVVAALFGAFVYGDVHGRIKEHAFMEIQSKKEAADAVRNALAAREAADKKFDSGRDNNRPGRLPGRVRHGSDGFARD